MLPPPPDYRGLLSSAAGAVRALTAVDTSSVEEELWDQLEQLEARRAKRAHRRSVNYAPPRCPVCHCFKTSPHAVCRACAYDPAVGWAA